MNPGEAAGASTPPHSTAPAEPEPPRTILVVDDEPDILQSFKDLLEQALPGIRVATARSGTEGLDQLAERSVDLVMSDFRMPGMNGIEFLVEARLRYPTLPRIMFTAFDDEHLARQAETDAVVDGFLSKNVGPAEMIRTVAALLDYPLPPGAWE